MLTHTPISAQPSQSRRTSRWQTRRSTSSSQMCPQAIATFLYVRHLVLMHSSFSSLAHSRRYPLFAVLGDMNNTSPMFGIAGTDQNTPTNSVPPSTLPPQTIPTRSATITRTDIVSTVGGASTSAATSISPTSVEPSGTTVPNSAAAGVMSTKFVYTVGALLAQLLVVC